MERKLVKTLKKVLGIQSPTEHWIGAKPKKETPPKRSWKDYLSAEQKAWHRDMNIMLCWQAGGVVLSVVSLVLAITALITRL